MTLLARFCFALAAAVICRLALADPTPAPRVRLIVPAYFYPAGPGLKEWDRLISSAGQVPVVAIDNPASGPGEKVDPNYTAVIARAKKAGLLLVGYVSTSYSRRPLAEAQADVDRWLRFYPEISGFFFDEQVSAADKVAYYASLYQHARKRLPAALVVTNPGTECAREYVAAPAADVVCIFENRQGFDAFRRPEWAAAFPPARFAALPYEIDAPERMEACLRDAVRRGIGNLYVTDARGANPWNRLPSYWDAEVAAVRRLNQEPAP